KFGLSLGKNGVWGPKVSINSYMAGGSVAANQWRLVDVPLSALGAQNTTITRLMLQDISGVAQPTVYIDDVEFYGGNTATPTATPVSSTPVPTQPAATQTAAPTQTPVPGSLVVSVDASADVHAISPLIYGVSDSSGAQTWYKDMGASFVRWGGNARTRHNWEINASNAGSDWEFRNVSQASGAAGSASYNFVTKNKSIGAESLLTIPTIGWVAKDGNNSTMSTNVPSEGGPPVSPGSEAIAGYDPTANRNATSVRSYPKKNAAFSYPPSTTDGAVYQDEWISYLKNTFGTAQNGGVRFYAMDNEMDLWADSTHVDVHPVRAGYDETLARHKQYAEAVLGVDPTAQITGPVGWGWLSLWYSALDRGNDAFATAADRAAHGGTPFLQWFLQQAKAYDQSVGRRTLHVLDTHYYPQGGVYSSAIDSTTQAKRLRSTRSLWDATYTEESWMANTEGGPNLRFIPRLREWIAAYYPGTRIGITEWNWGADSHVSGALAIADVLGIFGREDIYLANYWMSPANGSPGYWAWRMYRNYDGSYSRFGDVSVRAQMPAADVDKLSAYASKDSATGELKVMLINKMPGTSVNITLNVGNFAMRGTAKVYRYAAASTPQISQLAEVTAGAQSVNGSLPRYSITLLVISPSGTPIEPIPAWPLRLFLPYVTSGR
ncbi:MAG: hypothetical protein HY675_04555, partial [Chloroflexi bacterium]|nr:hypothetical protein [Chloroflexota bacterium]